MAQTQKEIEDEFFEDGIFLDDEVTVETEAEAKESEADGLANWFSAWASGGATEKTKDTTTTTSTSTGTSDTTTTTQKPPATGGGNTTQKPPATGAGTPVAGTPKDQSAGIVDLAAWTDKKEGPEENPNPMAKRQAKANAAKDVNPLNMALGGVGSLLGTWLTGEAGKQAGFSAADMARNGFSIGYGGEGGDTTIYANDVPIAKDSPFDAEDVTRALVGGTKSAAEIAATNAEAGAAKAAAGEARDARTADAEQEKSTGTRVNDANAGRTLGGFTGEGDGATDSGRTSREAITSNAGAINSELSAALERETAQANSDYTSAAANAEEMKKGEFGNWFNLGASLIAGGQALAQNLPEGEGTNGQETPDQETQGSGETLVEYGDQTGDQTVQEEVQPEQPQYMVDYQQPENYEMEWALEEERKKRMKRR